MWPFLPKNCDCNEAPTNPGTLCNENLQPSSDYVYDGDDLPCIGVKHGDDLTTAIQEIDYHLCSRAFTEYVLTYIENNIEVFPEFIELVNGVISCQIINYCGTSTTTSTSSSTSSTTTTTTTLPCNCFEVYANNGDHVTYIDCEDVEHTELFVGTPSIVPPYVGANSKLYCVKLVTVFEPYFIRDYGLCELGSYCNPTTTTTSSSSTTTSTSSTTSTTTTIAPLECISYTIEPHNGITHTVEYIPCSDSVPVTLNVTPEDSSVQICATVPLISDNYPQYTIVGENCFTPTTTSTTTINPDLFPLQGEWILDNVNGNVVISSINNLSGSSVSCVNAYCNFPIGNSSGNFTATPPTSDGFTLIDTPSITTLTLNLSWGTLIPGATYYFEIYVDGILITPVTYTYYGTPVVTLNIPLVTGNEDVSIVFNGTV